MKILHILAQKPVLTGSGIYLSSIIEEAAKKGYQQSVIIGIAKKEKYNFPKNVKIFPVRFQTRELPFPVVGMSPIMPYPSTCYCDMDELMISQWKNAFAKQLREAIKNMQPDIILSQHLWLLSALAKEMFPEIPLIAITHGTGLRQLQSAQKIAHYVKQHCNKIDLVLSLTPQQKELIHSKYSYPEEKIIVNGSGYNSNIFYLKRRSHLDTVKLVYAGKLCQTKGVFSLMHAIHNIMIENVYINFVGSASNSETMALLEKSADTFHSIMFSGVLSQNKLAQIFRNSDIFVLPSFFEGLPLVLIEAIASGMNVVVTDLPGIREFLGEEYCQSPYVSFVPLPRYKNLDTPLEKDLPKFEAFLKTAIEKQIYNIAERNLIPADLIERTVGRWTWPDLFKKIEIQMKKLV